jgi:hypothetical protein
VTAAVAAMTSHTGRLYALALAVVVFFLSWAAIAARPWAAAKQDARLTALTAREQRLRHDAVLVRRIVRHRWAVYRRQLAHRRAAIAAAQTRQRQLDAAAAAAAASAVSYSSGGGGGGGVRVVNLPPLTITRTS